MSFFTKDDNVISVMIKKRDWRIWFLYFLSFCFIGWLYEVLVFKFELGYGFVNRGFLFGPWLPVYGVGGMIILLSMNKWKTRIIRIGQVNIYYPIFVFCFHYTFVHSSRVINKLSYGICHGFLALGLYK